MLEKNIAKEAFGAPNFLKASRAQASAAATENFSLEYAVAARIITSIIVRP